MISTASANERIAEALRVIRAELARLRTDGATEQELADAKTYLTGALALSLDLSGSIASLLHSACRSTACRPITSTGAPALIGAVKLEDVRRVARRLLRDEAMTTVVVGKPVGLCPPIPERGRAMLYSQNIDDTLESKVGKKGLSLDSARC